MKRIMLVCLTALAVSGTYPLYAQSSESDFMAGDKSLFEEVTGIKKQKQPVGSDRIHDNGLQVVNSNCFTLDYWITLDAPVQYNTQTAAE